MHFEHIMHIGIISKAESSLMSYQDISESQDLPQRRRFTVPTLVCPPEEKHKVSDKDADSQDDQEEEEEEEELSSLEEEEESTSILSNGSENRDEWVIRAK